MSPNYWRHIRALLISIHLVAILLKAIPAPEGGMNRADWKNPTVQAEFKNVTQQLNKLGIETNQATVEKELWELAQGYMGIRKKLLSPFKKYYRYVGADQNWRLFIAPHMYPSRLSVDILIDGEWKTIYRPFDPEARWQSHLIENSRFRPSLFRYSWGRYKRHYHRFAEYLAVHAAQEFPEARQFRTRWWNARSPSPEQILQKNLPKGKWKSPLLFELDTLREEGL